MKKLIPFALFAASTLFAATSFAREGAREVEAKTEFGDHGTINIGAGTLLDASYTSTKPAVGPSSSSGHVMAMGDVAYFVADGVSVGGLVTISHSAASAPNQPTTKVTDLGVAALVGYNTWLTPGTLSFWPQVGFGYDHVGTSVGGSDVASGRTTLMIRAPFLFHPVKHFHFGIGPFLSMNLTSSWSSGSLSGDADKDTTFGISGEIAGWL
jgi:hypothetical protein